MQGQGLTIVQSAKGNAPLLTLSDNDKVRVDICVSNVLSDSLIRYHFMSESTFVTLRFVFHVLNDVVTVQFQGKLHQIEMP
jgi:hypothetical protein